MTIDSRLAAAVVIFFTHGIAAAQPAIAPPPHLALDEFVREYKRLGLPLPPPDAELMRLEGNEKGLFNLGFRVPEVPPPKYPEYLVGVNIYRPHAGEPIKNAADILRAVEPWRVVDLLCTAAQCRTRGMNDIAEALYACGVENTRNPVPPKMGIYANPIGGGIHRINGWRLQVEGDTRSVHLELRHAAFEYWQGQILEPGIDQHTVLRHLKATGFGPHPDIRDLERTLAPRTSRPGTVEALIDDLTEYRSWEGIGISPKPQYAHRGEDGYWKLADLGFDAVPALLAHAHDTRFTKHPPGPEHDALGVAGRLASRTRVGDLVQRLLTGVAGQHFPDGHAPPDENARAWWKEAQRAGEEKWLVANAIPDLNDRVVFRLDEPNEVMFRVLAVKYPARLPELYRGLLRDPRGRSGDRLELESRAILFAILGSSRPATGKSALLAAGLTHKLAPHRIAALMTLGCYDDEPAFAKLLLAALKSPADAENEEYGLWLKERLTNRLNQADPSPWEPLTARVWGATAGFRFAFLDRIKSRPEPSNRERIRVLIHLLSEPPRAAVGAPQVRDFAAAILAWELGIPFDLDAGPLSRFLLRAVVGQAATRALALGP